MPLAEKSRLSIVIFLLWALYLIVTEVEIDGFTSTKTTSFLSSPLVEDDETVTKFLSTDPLTIPE